MESGQISIHVDNILPIIKRWLYSEKEIYLRELVANAADAIYKLSKLALIGEVPGELPEERITITVDKDKKQLVISDTGLGMTAEEVKRYINQVAFSGLHDFVEKYKDKDSGAQVIGHFGLGFYSSFMVAGKVEIESLSYKEGAEPVHWSCDGSTHFEMTKGTRTSVGTSIILNIADDSQEMLEESTIRALLDRYCAFIRYPIELKGEVVNDPKPLFLKAAGELSDKDYLDFFRKLFPMSPDPLFWVHLNVDYPFRLNGVLYFPRLKHELDASQGEVKLYCNQVYVADNIKELIPEFLTLLKGVIDCPDLPLNVSRSYLQHDPTVRKIAEHITKKVADKLAGLAKTEPEAYRKYWDDIHPFVKFGMLRDQKFFERMKDHLIFRTASGGHVTPDEYLEKAKGKLDENTILYCSDPATQAALLRMLRDHELDAVVADTMIDVHFIPYYEMQTGRKYKFRRIDSDLVHHLVDKSASDIVVDSGGTTRDKIEALFRQHLSREKVKIRVERLKSDRLPAMLIFDEQTRRMKDMSRSAGGAAGLGGMLAGLPDDHTLVVNQANPAVANLLRMSMDFNRDEDVKLMVNQIYDLAWLQQGEFNGDMMERFLERSASILGRFGSAGAAGITAGSPAGTAGALEAETGKS